MILLLDCNFLAWRAFHTTGRLENGTVFGFLKAVQSLRERFQPDRIAFCFDGKHPLKRKLMFEGYKDRGLIPHEKVKASMGCYNAIDALRDEHLKALGFRNVFSKTGFEADDVIASIVRVGSPLDSSNWELLHDDVVIVSADHDLYQLLEGDRVKMWIPSKNRLYTERDFRDEWGIDPKLWPNVKAIAGCKSDRIPGVGGVGEKTAAAYLATKGNVHDHPKRLQRVFRKVTDKIDLVKFNLSLVRLPMEGVGTFRLKDDQATGGKWREWCERNKMASLIRGRLHDGKR